MTTQVHIVNSSDSNPRQHAKATFSRPGQEGVVKLLGPGESVAWWVGGEDKLTVVEVFEPKLKE